MKKFMMTVIGLLLSFQMLQANQIEKTVVLNAGYNAVQFDANVTLEELKRKIGAENLLNIQGAGQGLTYKKQYVDDGLEFLNSFTQTEAGKAFWFKVVEDVNFTYMADKQVNNKVIALGEGWSFIGAMLPLTLEEMKSQLGEDNLLIIQGAGQGSTYKKEYVDNGTPFLNSFTAFEVGKGYWVKVSSPKTLSFVFDLNKIVKDKTGNSVEVTRTIGGEVYTVRIYSDSTPTTEISQGTIDVYGNISGEKVVISINDSYPTDTKFQVKIFDANGDLVTQSNIVDYNASAIEFATLTIPNITPTISGKIEYERVHATHNGSSSALNYNNITIETAKQIVVKAINSTGDIIATTTTDNNGNYSFAKLPKNTSLKIRAYAKMLKANKWDTKVIDNSNEHAQYVIEGELVSTGTSNSIRNLKALASTKQSPPFAILDSIYLAMKKVLKADSSAVFPPLKMNWTVNNIESGTYYDGNDNIMIQGDQNGDSDEYDDHIMIHEWGHYFEAKFSRADSIGGQHGSGDSLDIRLAFGEGWGNALSGIVTDDPVYFDTYQNNGWNMNVESASHYNAGWYSEASIQRILYNLYDSNDDGADNLSLGFKPLYDVLVGVQKVTPAFTSIFSFIKALKDENVGEQGAIDSIVESENIATITDIWGTGRSNRTSSYPYHDLTVGDSVNVSTSSSDGKSNKLSNHQYVKFNIATAGNYAIRVKQTNGTNSDPDFVWYKTSPFTWLNKSYGVPNSGIEEVSSYFEDGKYILDIVDASNVSKAEYSVTITPQ